MNPANSDEAIRLVARDLAEGADMVMVKPGMPLSRHLLPRERGLRRPDLRLSGLGRIRDDPAAAQNGWIDGEKAMVESLMAFKRAGCDGILTYFAPAVAKPCGASAAVLCRLQIPQARNLSKFLLKNFGPGLTATLNSTAPAPCLSGRSARMASAGRPNSAPAPDLRPGHPRHSPT